MFAPVLRTLLKAGADPNLPCARGKLSIYEHARNYYNDSDTGNNIMRILQKFGGKDLNKEKKIVAGTKGQGGGGQGAANTLRKLK